MSPRVARALRWAVAIGLVAVVVARFDVATVAARIGAASPALVLVAIAGLVAVHVRRGPWGRLQPTPAQATLGLDSLAELPDALASLL